MTYVWSAERSRTGALGSTHFLDFSDGQAWRGVETGIAKTPSRVIGLVSSSLATTASETFIGEGEEVFLVLLSNRFCTWWRSCARVTLVTVRQSSNETIHVGLAGTHSTHALNRRSHTSKPHPRPHIQRDLVATQSFEVFNFYLEEGFSGKEVSTNISCCVGRKTNFKSWPAWAMFSRETG